MSSNSSNLNVRDGTLYNFISITNVLIQTLKEYKRNYKSLTEEGYKFMEMLSKMLDYYILLDPPKRDPTITSRFKRDVNTGVPYREYVNLSANNGLTEQQIRDLQEMPEDQRIIEMQNMLEDQRIKKLRELSKYAHINDVEVMKSLNAISRSNSVRFKEKIMMHWRMLVYHKAIGHMNRVVKLELVEFMHLYAVLFFNSISDMNWRLDNTLDIANKLSLEASKSMNLPIFPSSEIAEMDEQTRPEQISTSPAPQINYETQEML